MDHFLFVTQNFHSNSHPVHIAQSVITENIVNLYLEYFYDVVYFGELKIILCN